MGVEPSASNDVSKAVADDRRSSEQALAAVVSELVCELHPQRAKTCSYALSSRLEQDLGIDSLGRTELILRVERAFHRRLPVNTLAEAETIGDLLRALEEATQKAPPDAGPKSFLPFPLCRRFPPRRTRKHWSMSLTGTWRCIRTDCT